MSEPLGVAILGCTGSIGSQTLDVVRLHPDRLRVVALAARKDAQSVAAVLTEFPDAQLALFDEQAARWLGEQVGKPVASGVEGLASLAVMPQADVVVVAVAGMIGLQPTIEALKAGKRVALASKEALVAGGAVVMPLANDDTLRPIDSEHSAIRQCLQGEDRSGVERIFLTSSGGPFRGWTPEQLREVTIDQALNHPTWKMGGKITIDSATLMNKGLELIEACWLFGVAADGVEVVVHPQSVIHSMVKFRDGSVLAQMGHPDMKLPIQYALLGPERLPSPARDWQPMHTPSLTFEPVDDRTFPSVSMAREAFRAGGVVPTALNAVNEEAVRAFLTGRLAFVGIFEAVGRAVSAAPRLAPTLDNILHADQEFRGRFNADLAEGVYSKSAL
ncbi:MAG: 1-deoxy-D-xylulose-5-phosphate reductoisomerase [Armatimonadota bacterium]